MTTKIHKTTTERPKQPHKNTKMTIKQTQRHKTTTKRHKTNIKLQNDYKTTTETQDDIKQSQDDNNETQNTSKDSFSVWWSCCYVRGVGGLLHEIRNQGEKGNVFLKVCVS